MLGASSNIEGVEQHKKNVEGHWVSPRDIM